MKSIFGRRFKKIFTALLFLFLILFVFRLIYGYNLTSQPNFGQVAAFEDFQLGQRNIASKKYKTIEAGNATTSVQVDQKYEKIAEVNTKSHKFEEEEKIVRQQIVSKNALIQYEQKRGNKGYRNLKFLIGVPPENFDSLYEELIQIGNVQSKQITKKDKTNEYKELNAKKASLEKILASMIDLKSKGGKIEEYINLENRILDIQQQLQGLGVNLGDFDSENEFCTVVFTLLEGRKNTISLTHRVKVALEWTIEYYWYMMVALAFAAFSSLIFVIIIDKVKNWIDLRDNL